MKILAFGILAEKIGTTSIVVENIHDTNGLKNELFRLFPDLQELNFIISVNRKIIHENMVLDANAEVALLPPFSGG